MRMKYLPKRESNIIASMIEQQFKERLDHKGLIFSKTTLRAIIATTQSHKEKST